MKSKKEIAILFFMIAVLAFYISSEKSEKTHYELPDVQSVDTEDISKIKITKKDTEIVIAKEGDKWFAGDGKYPADKHRVEKIINAIAGFSLIALASESENYAMYELDGQHCINIEAYKGDTLLRKITAGKNTPSNQQTFVMIDNDHRVYHSREAIRRDFDLTLAELRDKTVMSFSDEISEIVLKKGDEEMKLIRTAAPEPLDLAGEHDEEASAGSVIPKWMTPDGRGVKETEIDNMVQSLSQYQSDEFIDDKTREDFTSPIFTAALQGVETYTISFFEKKDEKYPAVSSQSKYPFLVSEWKAKKIMKDFHDLLEQEQ